MDKQDFSVLKSLFDGKMLIDKVFPFPEQSAEDKETMQMFLDSVEGFCKENINGDKIEREKNIPREILEGLGELGVFGITIPEEYGGSGLGPTIYSRVVGTISKYCSSTAITIGAHQSIGYKPIILYGSEEQKQKYLPSMATGEKLAAYAITEANAGSDNMSIRTTADLSADESHFIVNGNKLWITNGGIADVFTILAKTKKGQTMFVIDKEMGVVAGQPEDKLGLRGSSTTELVMENVKVPAENVVGRYGLGFKVAMETLTHGRLGLAGSCSVLADHCLKLAVEQAKNREQFKRQIIDFGMIREKISYIGTSAYVCDAMTLMTSNLYEQNNNDISIEADVCKTFCTEDLWIDINEALQIAAGNGYMNEYQYPRLLRDNRINQIFEGTSEIQRFIVGHAVLRNIRLSLNKGLINENSNIPLPNLPNALSDSATKLLDINEILTKKSINLIKKYDAEIFNNQYMISRIADITMYLYALLATISKTDSIIREKGDNAAQLPILYCNNFAFRAKNTVLGLADNVDHNMDDVKDEITTILKNM